MVTDFLLCDIAPVRGSNVQISSTMSSSKMILIPLTFSLTGIISMLFPLALNVPR